MRFPYKIKDFKSVQRNFDYLVSWFQAFSLQASRFNGPWGAGVPGATVGIPFTVKRDCSALIICETTGYTSAGGTFQVDVYIDGVLTGHSIFMNATTPSVQRFRGGPSFQVVSPLKAGIHYMAYRQFSGVTDAADYGTIVFITMPL